MNRVPWKKHRGKLNSAPKWGEQPPQIPQFIFMFWAPGTSISCTYSVYREPGIKFSKMALMFFFQSLDLYVQ